MKALTVWQPWASAIAYGPKRIENRCWRPSETRLPLRIAIHAGAKLHEDGFSFCESRGLVLRDTPRSAILAIATVVGVVEDSDDPWFMGPLGWVLDDVLALPRPIPCSGAQQLWDVPLAIRRKIDRICATTRRKAGR